MWTKEATKLYLEIATLDGSYQIKLIAAALEKAYEEGLAEIREQHDKEKANLQS